jgi:hypothetical protein
MKQQENISRDNFLSPRDIDWSPLSRAYISFKTRRAALVEENMLIFVPTKRAILAYIFFINVCGFALLTILKDEGNNISAIMLPSILLIVSVIFLWAGIKPVVFNKRNNLYYSSWIAPQQKSGKAFPKWRHVPLDEINSVQVLSYMIPMRNDGYELNLVLKDASRVYVTGHKDLKQISRDAAMIAGFLNIPLWKFVGNETNF